MTEDDFENDNLTEDAAEMTWPTRDYRVEDNARLLELARAAVRALDDAVLTDAAKNVWLAEFDDIAGFHQRLVDGWVRIACDGAGRCVGFGEIHPPGEIGMLYTDPALWRQGVAVTVMDDLLALAGAMGAKLVTAPSQGLGRGFFLAQGFVEIEGSGGKWLQRSMSRK